MKHNFYSAFLFLRTIDFSCSVKLSINKFYNPGARYHLKTLKVLFFL